MLTTDQKPGLNATSISEVLNTSPSSCMVLPGYGYDSKFSASRICDLGFWNMGYNKEACLPCEEGSTTIQYGATSQASCVTSPGWYLDLSQSAYPAFCDVDFFCPGLITSEAIPCPNGTATMIGGSSSAEQCDGESGLQYWVSCVGQSKSIVGQSGSNAGLAHRSIFALN
jgi:hypothetical protein